MGMEIYDVNVYWDEEGSVWVASCDDVPLTLHNNTIELLMGDVRETALEIFELEKRPTEEVAFKYQIEERLATAI